MGKVDDACDDRADQQLPEMAWRALPGRGTRELCEVIKMFYTLIGVVVTQGICQNTSH